jgi:hypothetical protein
LYIHEGGRRSVWRRWGGEMDQEAEEDKRKEKEKRGRSKSNKEHLIFS